MRRAVRVGMYAVIVVCVLAALVAAIADQDWVTVLGCLALAGLAAYSVALDREVVRAERRAAIAAEQGIGMFRAGVKFGRAHEYGDPTPPARPETPQEH